MPTIKNTGEGKERPPREERPPRRTTRGRTRTSDDTATKIRTPADKKLAASIASGYQTIGGLTIGIGARLQDEGLVGTGAATINNAEMIAEAWIEVAQKNPKVKAWLEKITEVSAMGVLISLHIATAMPLLIDRGVIPPGVAFAMAGNTPSENGGSPSDN